MGHCLIGLDDVLAEEVCSAVGKRAAAAAVKLELAFDDSVVNGKVGPTVGYCQ